MKAGILSGKTTFDADGGGDHFRSTISINPTEIKKIHLIFKTHLDLGFTDFARNVKNKYFKEYIPQAITLAKSLRESACPERFVWTTGSWLIFEFLEQADRNERTLMENAIFHGDIVWHALPFTFHTELLDPSLMRYGLSLAKRLDDRFGKKTISAKMTDVPGHTRGLVPLLAEAGVSFLHLGVNPASSAPDVPDVFRWKHTDGSEVIVMYHKDDYGLMSVAGDMDTAISFAHTGDNRGPQTVDAVIRIFNQMRDQFPGAEIVASSMDAYVEELLKHRHQLPVVTGELGDTWIHGAATDPWKVAAYRALCRLRLRWQAEGSLDESKPDHDLFSRTLMCVPEHTWGMGRFLLDDYEAYGKEQLKALRATDKCRKVEQSWAEQRQYVTDAVNALIDPAMADQARKELNELIPGDPDTSAYHHINAAASILETKHFKLGFDPLTGAVNYLFDRTTGHKWADFNHLLGLFRYDIFSQKEFARFAKQYLTQLNNPNVASWAIPTFTKPGMDPEGKIPHQTWFSQLQALHSREDDKNAYVLAELTMPEMAIRAFGAPARLAIELELPHEVPEIRFALQWFEKDVCRLPEAAWLSFCPRTSDRNGWMLDKMGVPISPLEIVSKGNRKLHALQKGLTYKGSDGQLAIQTLDAPIVAPGLPSLLDFNQRQPAVKKGMHFNLLNNQWNTNFRYWYEENAKFRFILSFH